MIIALALLAACALAAVSTWTLVARLDSGDRRLRRNAPELRDVVGNRRRR